MRCPFCSNQDSQVKDSRPTEDNTAIRRRRICDQCGSRFTTFERIQLRDLIVLKTNGKKEVFDKCYKFANKFREDLKNFDNKRSYRSELSDRLGL